MNKLRTRVRTMDRQQLESIFTSSAFLVTNGLLFINLFILARALGDDGRGAVAAAYGNTVVIGWAFQIGVPNAAAYFAKDIDNRRVMMSSWVMMLTAAIPMAVLMIPFYLWQMSGESFTEGGADLKYWYLAFIALQLFNGPFLSCVFWLRGIGNLVRFNALLALPQVLISAGYVILFATDTMTVNRALASTFIMTSIGWVAALSLTRSWPGSGYSQEVLKKVRHFDFRAWVGNLSFFVSLRIDQLLLVNFVPLGELGVYAAAAAISTVSSPIARGIAQAMLPFIRNAESDEERLGRINRSLVQIASLSLAIVLAIAATAWAIIPFVLGDRFEGAVLPLMILLPGAWATDVSQVLITALSAFNRPEDGSKAQIASAIATAIGLIILLSPYGVVGAAITTSVSYWVGLIALYYFWRRLAGRVRRGEATGHTERVEESV